MELNAVFFQTPDLTLIMTGCKVEEVVARFTGVTCCQFTLRRPDYCLVQTGWRWKRVGATYTWQHINLVQSSSFPEAVHSFNFLHPTTRMTYHKNENKIGVSVLEAMLVKSCSCPWRLYLAFYRDTIFYPWKLILAHYPIGLSGNQDWFSSVQNRRFIWSFWKSPNIKCFLKL